MDTENGQGKQFQIFVFSVFIRGIRGFPQL